LERAKFPEAGKKFQDPVQLTGNRSRSAATAKNVDLVSDLMLAYIRKVGRIPVSTAKPILKLFRPSGSPIILVSSDPWNGAREADGYYGTLIGSHGCQTNSIIFDDLEW